MRPAILSSVAMFADTETVKQYRQQATLRHSYKILGMSDYIAYRVMVVASGVVEQSRGVGKRYRAWALI